MEKDKKGRNKYNEICKRFQETYKKTLNQKTYEGIIRRKTVIEQDLLLKLEERHETDMTKILEDFGKKTKRTIDEAEAREILDKAKKEQKDKEKKNEKKRIENLVKELNKIREETERLEEELARKKEKHSTDIKELTKKIVEFTKKANTYDVESKELNDILQKRTTENMKLRRKYLNNMQPGQFAAVEGAEQERIPILSQYTRYEKNRGKYTKRVIYIDANNVAIR